MYPCRTDFSTDWSAKGKSQFKGGIRGQELPCRSGTRRRVGTGERAGNSLRGQELPVEAARAGAWALENAQGILFTARSCRKGARGGACSSREVVAREPQHNFLVERQTHEYLHG